MPSHSRPHSHAHEYDSASDVDLTPETPSASSSDSELEETVDDVDEVEEEPEEKEDESKKEMKVIKKRKAVPSLAVADVYGPKATHRWVSDASQKRLLIPQLLVDLSRVLRKRKASKTSPAILTALSKRLESYENQYAHVEGLDLGGLGANIEVLETFYSIQSALFAEQTKHIEERHSVLAKKAIEHEATVAALEEKLDGERRKLRDVRGEMGRLGEELDAKKHEVMKASEEHAGEGAERLRTLRVHDWVYEVLKD